MSVSSLLASNVFQVLKLASLAPLLFSSLKSYDATLVLSNSRLAPINLPPSEQSFLWGLIRQQREVLYQTCPQADSEPMLAGISLGCELKADLRSPQRLYDYFGRKKCVAFNFGTFLKCKQRDLKFL